MSKNLTPCWRGSPWPGTWKTNEGLLWLLAELVVGFYVSPFAQQSATRLKEAGGGEYMCSNRLPGSRRWEPHIPQNGRAVGFQEAEPQEKENHGSWLTIASCFCWYKRRSKPASNQHELPSADSWGDRKQRLYLVRFLVDLLPCPVHVLCPSDGMQSWKCLSCGLSLVVALGVLSVTWIGAVRWIRGNRGRTPWGHAETLVVSRQEIFVDQPRTRAKLAERYNQQLCFQTDFNWGRFLPYCL